MPEVKEYMQWRVNRNMKRLQYLEAAASCVGVDLLVEGVSAMQAAGFEAVAHDLSTGLGPLADRAPFDLIVAGELIEHVGDLDFLFSIARDGLTADGELILTTPNPYAPARVCAGQRGIVWENADHVTYLFPSGVAELAERHGLSLTGATTIATPAHRRGPVRWLKQAVRGSGWRSVGYDTTAGGGRQVSLAPSLLDRLRARGPARFLGETFVYIVSRPGEGLP